jgi:hypothetical protein
MQTVADQDESDVQDKSVVANAPEVSFSTAITRTSGSSSQRNQVYNNPERTQVHREMERTGKTSYTSTRIMTETVHSFELPLDPTTQKEKPHRVNKQMNKSTLV